MESKKLNLRKSLVCAVLIVVIFSGMATSMAYARDVAPPQTPPDDKLVAPGDNPVLIAIQDNATTGSNDTPLLDRAQDNATTTPDENGTLYHTQDTSTEDNPLLISPQAQPNNTATIVGVAVKAAAIAVAAVLVVLRIRKKM